MRYRDILGLLPRTVAPYLFLCAVQIHVGIQRAEDRLYSADPLIMNSITIRK